jgi:hypothetical protein
MTGPTPEEQRTGSAEGSGPGRGGPPAGEELGDQVSDQAQTGISSPDAEERAGQEAPASEGELPG